MSHGFSSIEQLLAEIFRAKKWDRRKDLHAVWDVWDKMVGMDICRHAQPNVIRGTVLWINVTDSVWMQQLHLLKPFLLAQINQRLQGCALTDLHFRLASSVEIPDDRQDAAPPVRPQLISKEREQKFMGHLDNLHDEELKTLLIRLWRRYEEYHPG